MLGFIGIGTIGAPMAARLLEGGHALKVYDLDPVAVERLAALGAEVATTIAEIAAGCTTVFLSLPGPVQIEAVVLGDDGLLEQAAQLTTIVDLSTNSVALNRDLAARAAARGIDYLDAPVSGGRVAAQKGALAVMVGGEETAFKAVHPLLECFGENIFYLGPAASGTLAKLVNNQIFLGASVLIQEGFVMGAKAGMDAATLLEVLKVSSAGTLLARAPLVLSRKFDLDIFALAIAAKDVALAVESGTALGVSMPMSAAAEAVYRAALEQGLGADDFFATVKVLEAAAGVELQPLEPPRAKRR